MSKKPILGIDIGTGKTAIALAEYDSDGNFYVRNVGTVGSQGVAKGSIAGWELIKPSIDNALTKALEGSKKKKKYHAVVTVSGDQVLCRRATHTIALKGRNPKVTKGHIAKLLKQLEKTPLRKDEHLLMRTLQSYTLDGNFIDTPLGMPGHTLEQALLQVSVMKKYLDAIEQLLHPLKITVIDFIYNPLAGGEVLLTENERTEGVINIEIGAGLTSVSLFRHDKLELSENIYVGGSHIEQDIAYGLKISKPLARKILFEHGQIMPDKITTKKISINSEEERTAFQVPHDFLCKIIQSRVHEILSMVWGRLEEWKKITELPKRIVLSGGVSLITDIDVFCSKLFEIPSRRGIPEDKWDLLDDPIYATAIGAVIASLKNGVPQNYLGLKGWFKEFF